MSIETTIFNHTYNSLPWSKCQIKIGRLIIERATVAGVGINVENTDQGQYGGIAMETRLLAEDEPGGKVAIGQVLYIKQPDRDWVPTRVAGRFTQGGVTRLSLEAVNE